MLFPWRGRTESKQIERIQLVHKSYEREVPRGSFCAPDDFLIINLDDESEISRLYQLINSHPEWHIRCEDVQNDVRTLREALCVLVVPLGTDTAVEESTSGYYVRLSKNYKVDVPENVEVEEEYEEDGWLETWKLRLPWEPYAAFLGRIWKVVSGSPGETRFQRVMLFHLKCQQGGCVEGSEGGETGHE